MYTGCIFGGMRESVVLVFLPENAVRVLLESLHVVTTARHGGDGGATVTRSAMLWIHSIWDCIEL